MVVIWVNTHVNHWHFIVKVRKLTTLSLPYFLPWPVYSVSCTSSGISTGPHWLPDKVTLPTSVNCGVVKPGNLRGLGWHRTGKNYSSDPIHATEVQSSAWGTWIVTIVIDFLHLTVCCTEQNATMTLFDKWWFITDCWFNPYQAIFGQFSQLLNFPLKLMCVSFLFSIYIMC